MSHGVLVGRYAAFALIATLANLTTQRLVLAGEDGALFFGLALAAGTLVGLVIKYLLDKRWIFRDLESGLKTHRRKFTLYAMMGLLTTGIFWGVETIFWLVWRTDLMRETGAILGLTIGYVVKYRLDQRFVFVPAASDARR